MTVCRLRRNFGAPFLFTDRNVSNAKDGVIDCLSYEDSGFALLKLELDKATQVCARLMFIVELSFHILAKSGAGGFCVLDI